MAFEQPLEADQVDLNLGSIFAKAPVIGSLMYLFGGDRAKEDEEEERRQKIIMSSTSNDSNDDDDHVMNTALPTSMLHNKQQQQPPRKSALKKAPPSLAGSEISDIGECSEAAASLEGMMHLVAIHDNNNNNNDHSESSSSLKTSSLGLKKRKSLSWSDQSGQNLVEYIYEESGPVATANATSLEASKHHNPYTNVMTRSLSVRNQLLEDNEGRQKREKKTYLPKMQGGNNGGIIMPSMHNSHPSSAAAAAGSGGNGGGGVESPQWGWYINTTPPTPEMYHSCVVPIKKSYPGDSASQASTASMSSSYDSASTAGTTLIAFPHSHAPMMPPPPKPNHVFRNLQENKKNRINFPSVPAPV